MLPNKNFLLTKFPLTEIFFYIKNFSSTKTLFQQKSSSILKNCPLYKNNFPLSPKNVLSYSKKSFIQKKRALT